MLKLSVGYKHNSLFPFSKTVIRYADAIKDVYFPWLDMPSGRATADEWDEEIFLQELRQIKDAGIELNLLFNANCYGKDAISTDLKGKVTSVIDRLAKEKLKPDTVTTTSPAIAYIIKTVYNDEIKLKASVNMKISSVKGMEYVAHLFDDFCLAKECNRNIPLLRELKFWAEENGKHITILANSGCMRDCSGQIFHDNMVAHQTEIEQNKNIPFLPYMCWNHLKNPENFASVLQNTWVRPEDIGNYDGLADTVKLATRTHELAGMVIGAYARRYYAGNLLDLFEPSYSPAFAPYIIDSSKIPEDFWQKTTQCDKKCNNCNYCKNVLQRTLICAE